MIPTTMKPLWLALALALAVAPIAVMADDNPSTAAAPGLTSAQRQAIQKTMEARLTRSRYLFGDRPLETDWRFFVTLLRFDAVYNGHFKCNLRRIADYPNLFGYLRDLYQIDGVAQTVNFDHIKRHYYYTHDDINPTRIVPIGPLQDLEAPHGREKAGVG